MTVLRSYNEWQGVLAFDEFSQSVLTCKRPPWGVNGKWTDHEDRLAADWLQRNCGVNLPIHIVAEAVQVVARENSFDPVRKYLDGLGGIERNEPTVGWRFTSGRSPRHTYLLSVSGG